MKKISSLGDISFNAINDSEYIVIASEVEYISDNYFEAMNHFVFEVEKRLMNYGRKLMQNQGRNIYTGQKITFDNRNAKSY